MFGKHFYANKGHTRERKTGPTSGRGPQLNSSRACSRWRGGDSTCSASARTDRRRHRIEASKFSPPASGVHTRARSLQEMLDPFFGKPGRVTVLALLIETFATTVGKFERRMYAPRGRIRRQPKKSEARKLGFSQCTTAMRLSQLSRGRQRGVNAEQSTPAEQQEASEYRMRMPCGEGARHAGNDAQLGD